MTRVRIELLVTVAAGLALGGCELGTKITQQTGYRGTAMDQITDPDFVVKTAALPAAPYELPADEGPLARDEYQNVPVLGGLSTERFNHLMSSITYWVTGDAANCAYCHNPENLASDEKYTKVVARRMLQMTWKINGDWSTHVKQTGVTCWTCHRGNPVPANVWSAPLHGNLQTIRGQRFGQNTPHPDVAYASLPSSAVFSDYLAADPKTIRVAGNAYPSKAHVVSIKTAEGSYGIMMHVSQALGVNCTYCHNTQSFKSWSLSNAQRTTAWYGLNMVRNLNTGYVLPLTPVFPANRKGPAGDPYQINCLTCHQGQAKPLGGQSMLGDYPYMRAAPGKMITAAIPQGEGLISGEFGGAPMLTVYFDTAKAGVTNRLGNESAALRAFLEAHPEARVSISGYVDPRGSTAMNAELAKNRAVNVRSALIAAGVPDGRIDLDKPADIVAEASTFTNDRKVEVKIKGLAGVAASAQMTGMEEALPVSDPQRIAPQELPSAQPTR